MNNLQNKLFSLPLTEITPMVQPKPDLDQNSSQFIPSSQNPLLTQNSSLEGVQKPKKQKKGHRRSRNEKNGRDFRCDCGKSYLSQPALNNHIKNKHPERHIKRDKGRPLKYPKKSRNDFEKDKYNSFFIQNGRIPEDEKPFEVLPLIQESFSFIYESRKSSKLFLKPKSYNDIPVLLNLISRNLIMNRTKNEKSCDEVFTEYLLSFMNKTNKKYFLFMLKFILLFREFYDISRNKDKKDEEKKVLTNSLPPNGLPDLCNEFYEFMENNDFFEMNEDEKIEFVEIIQHFCIWLFKNDYTKSKLVLAS